MFRNTNKSNRSIESRNVPMVESLEDRCLRSVSAPAGPMNFDLARDGQINGDDLFVVDSHVGQAVSGWANGDVNNDGVVDSTDQELETSAFNAFNAGATKTLLPGGIEATLILMPGDANGDGEVNADDQWAIDNSINSGKGGWADGDFNGDGDVNADDQFALDVYASSHGDFNGDGVITDADYNIYG